MVQFSKLLLPRLQDIIRAIQSHKINVLLNIEVKLKLVQAIKIRSRQSFSERKLTIKFQLELIFKSIQ